jgi:hypothetical protein
VLFRLPAALKKEEQVGEPQLRGVQGEEEDDSEDGVRLGSEAGAGRTIVSGGFDLGCMEKRRKERRNEERIERRRAE